MKRNNINIKLDKIHKNEENAIRSIITISGDNYSYAQDWVIGLS